ncbi:hypothetical protein P170DRAFT_505704 [Aspergillus steynii IBT 23096]|uniref:Aminoglycoside phosphotransferase domain-containing protein n=1 Tax=Aspergillus steynii IBT 23096 TaxID=1392250 RepID=A0A2I2GQD0_9EURO|nr:uncharacterized protein P170DRAFT_505704 [Aspergillus steynii IBT 23096]PLB55080.1 hypothetical protein P170DRAFT_505704 [Aspergillus steynii IBT 23096]
MSTSTVDHKALISEILDRDFCLEVSDITSLGYGRSNLVFLVNLPEPTKGIRSQTQDRGSLKPGTVPIPRDTSKLIFRFFRPFDTYNESARAENKVAAMSIASSALSHSQLPALVPQVYGWDSGAKQPSPLGWVLEEYIEGKNLAEDFANLPISKQRIILAQIADVTKAFQIYELPDTVTGFGGLAFDRQGKVCSGLPSFHCPGAPIGSIASFYQGLLSWHLQASERYGIINGWRDSNLRDRLDQFIANGAGELLVNLPSDRPTFIQGSLEPIKTLYDPETLRITAILDYGLSHIAIPVVEFLYSFTAFSGSLTAPFDKETERLRHAMLHGFPEIPPISNPMRQGPAMFGSGRDIQWGLAKAWEVELERVGALRPRNTEGADLLSQVHWFIQDLAPWHLYDPDILQIRTKEQLLEARENTQETLQRYLETWGY